MVLRIEIKKVQNGYYCKTWEPDTSGDPRFGHELPPKEYVFNTWAEVAAGLVAIGFTTVGVSQ